MKKKKENSREFQFKLNSNLFQKEKEKEKEKKKKEKKKEKEKKKKKEKRKITWSEVIKSPIPSGMKMTPIKKKVGSTVFGVSNGCHAFRRCCLKAESFTKEEKKLISIVIELNLNFKILIIPIELN